MEHIGQTPSLGFNNKWSFLLERILASIITLFPSFFSITKAENVYITNIILYHIIYYKHHKRYRL